jgi:hypothetical protein
MKKKNEVATAFLIYAVQKKKMKIQPEQREVASGYFNLLFHEPRCF